MNYKLAGRLLLALAIGVSFAQAGPFINFASAVMNEMVGMSNFVAVILILWCVFASFAGRLLQALGSGLTAVFLLFAAQPIATWVQGFAH